MLRHDRNAPLDQEWTLSFEYIRRQFGRWGAKLKFEAELVASLCPEDGNVRCKVFYIQDGWNRLLMVRAIQGHSVPMLKNLQMSHITLSSGEMPEDSRRGHGVEQPTARTLIHAARETTRTPL